MRPCEMIQQLEANSSRKAKQAVLERFLHDPEVQQGLCFALDNLVTFGVRQVPVSDHDGDDTAEWKDFVLLANSLIRRELTGNAAANAVREFMRRTTAHEWNTWYRRILIKDLRCGVSEKTVNSVAKTLGMQFRIPVFECMLSHDGTKYPGKITGDCVVEVKYDGVRVITVVDVQSKSVTMYSRNGKTLENFPHIVQAFQHVVLPQLTTSMVFDGEIMSENFQALMRQVHRKNSVDTSDAYLAVFDVLTLDEFRAGGCDRTVLERKQILHGVDFGNTNIVPVQYHTVHVEQQAERFAQINAEALAAGYEGLMIKPVTGDYVCKRSANWLKVKPFIEVTLSVVDVEEGTGRNQGRLGALIVEGVDDGIKYHVNVGSGFSDAQRDEFWQKRQQLIGQLVEVRADATTQNQNGGDVYSLRFPRFKTFRGVTPGEKM